MDKDSYKLRVPAMLSIPLRDAELLMDAGDGDGALLYLYLLKNGGTLDMERAAAALRLSAQGVRQIALRLERLGLLSGGAGEREQALDLEMPEYQAADVVRRSQSDPAFHDLMEEAQKTLGRILSTADVKALFWIYDELALPVDVIMLLLHRCKEENDERYGSERALGFAVVKKMAREWFDRELVTCELAENYLAEQDRRRTLIAQVQRAIGIQDRKLSPTEGRYIADWLELGFGPEELAIAADRTVTNTGGLKWKYMNSIVRSWHSKGLHTVEQIEQRDKKPDSDWQQIISPAADAQELERMKKLRERLRSQ